MYVLIILRVVAYKVVLCIVDGTSIFTWRCESTSGHYSRSSTLGETCTSVYWVEQLMDKICGTFVVHVVVTKASVSHAQAIF